MDGLELLAEIRALRPDTPTMMITGHGEHDLVVSASAAGPMTSSRSQSTDYSSSCRRRDAGSAAEAQKLVERHLDELAALPAVSRASELPVRRRTIGQLALDEVIGPLRRALTTRSCSPWPVIIMVGVSGLSARISAKSSRPSIPGILISVTIAS